MPYTEPQVTADLAAIAANPAIMAGAVGGSGVSFHTRLLLRAAAYEVAPSTSNIETLAKTTLVNTIIPKATSKAAK